jgi:DNA-binding LytR/AlgR family response regulator
MKLRALVIEDEWAARNYLVELLHAAGAEVLGAVATTEDARAVLDAPDGGPIDVAFVDVQLVGSERDDEGLALVSTYAPRPGAPAFVLATAFGQHALAAFELGVVDYLLKPFTPARVEECLARIAARRPAAPTAPLRIVARRKRALVFLRIDELWAFEAADRLAYVHTARGRFDVDLSLSAIDASFGRTLLRVHRNWLVNPAFVQELEGTGSDTELLVGSPTDPAQGLRVPVARDRAATVRDALLVNATGLRAR